MISGVITGLQTKSSVAVAVIVKRQTHAYLNKIGADNPVDHVQVDGVTPESALGLVADDLKFHAANDPTNGAAGYTVTWFPDPGMPNADGGNTYTFDNIDTHPRGGKSDDFVFSGLTQGFEVTGYFEVNSACSFGRRVRVRLKTHPDGEVKLVGMSCMGMYYPNVYTDAGDLHTYMKIGKLIEGIDNDVGLDTVYIVDDGTYQSINGATDPEGVAAPWNPTKTIADTVAEPQRSPQNMGVLANEVNLTADFTLSNGWHTVHTLNCAVLNPAFQRISKRAGMRWKIQDHDAISGNDYDFTVKHYASLDDSIQAWNNTSTYFWYWWTGNPASYAANLTEGDVPEHLEVSQGVYTSDFVNPINHKPRYFKEEYDFADVYVIDCQSHRSAKGDSSVTASILGSTQLTDLLAALTTSANAGKMIIFFSPMMVIRSQNNNTQSWVSSNEDGGAAPTAPDERNILMDHLKGLDVDVFFWVGDTHFQLMASDTDRIMQMSCGPVCRDDTLNRARYQRWEDADAIGQGDSKWPKQDDLFLDQRQNDASQAASSPDGSGFHYFSGRHEDSTVGSVIADNPSSTSASFSLEFMCGFGFTHIMQKQAYHMQINSQGYCSSGTVIVQEAA